MARTTISFSRVDTGLTISNLVWDFCKKISDGSTVVTTGSTLTECGVGVYLLDNPNVTDDTIFSIYVSGDTSKYSEGIFSLVDGDSAKESTILKSMDLTESQRGHHTWSGNIFYVGPTYGNDSTGTGSRSLPYKTVTKALSMCVDNNHDVIFILPDSTTTPTILTEDIIINKSYTFLRGPGRDLKIQSTAGSSKNAIKIQSSGVEICGFQTTSNGNAGTPILVSSADFSWIHHIYVDTPTQDCIEVNVGTNTLIENCVLMVAGRSGVRISSGSGSGYHTIIRNNIIRDCVGNGIDLLGTDASECRIQNNTIRDNSIGVNISTGVIDTIITDNRFIGNSGGYIVDLGVSTLKEWNTFDELVTQNWSKNLTTFTTAMSSGKLLQESVNSRHYDISSSGDVVVDAGNIVSGDYTSIQHYDANRLVIAELSVNPSLIVTMTFRAQSADEMPNKFIFQGRYDHNSAKTHHCDVYAYNFQSSTWEMISSSTNYLDDEIIDYNREFPLSLSHIQETSGIIQIRINHDPINTGNINDRLYINHVCVTTRLTSQLTLNDMITIVPPYMADAIWDETLSGSAHNTNGTAGKLIQTISANVVYSGTVVGSTNNTLTFDSLADTHDGAYDPSMIAIITGTGAGQCRMIIQYDGTTQTAVIDRNWKILPTTGDTFIVYANPGREHVNEGLLRAVNGNQVQLNTNANTVDGCYNGQVIFFRSGTGEDQAFRIIDYNGATQTATLCDIPHITPDTTTGYVMLPTAVLRPDVLAPSLIENGMASQVSVDNIQNDLKRVLGLMHENIYIDNTTYDEFNNLVTARVRIYSTSSDVGSSNNVIGEYQIYSDNQSEGKFNNWRQIKI